MDRQDSKMDVSMLETHGFVSVSYPPSLRECVQDAMESWKAFCDLPLETKKRLSGGNRIDDFGYMYREDAGQRADRKQLFHALRSNLPLLVPIAREIADERATNFITAIDALIVAMTPMVREFAAGVEDRFGLSDFEKQVFEQADNWTFRYLHYPPGARPVLANAHADKGGFTFHLGETEEGGEYLDIKDKIWRPWPVSEKQTIIFPSMTMQHRSRGLLNALWHRVVPNQSTIASGRYSMVAFIDFTHSHRINTEEFRMQNFDAGFNYALPFGEFEKLFVPR